MVENIETLVVEGKNRLRRLTVTNLTLLEREVVSRLAALPQQDVESIRRIRREFSKQLPEASAEEVVRIALNLARRSEIRYRFFAYELIHHHEQALRSLRTRSLEELGKGIDSWGTVDCFACYLAGPAWRENQAPDTLIKRWARSKDRWWRRAALVSTVPLNSKARGGKGDVRRTLEICELLVDDREDMVVKALSWALRELAKRNPESVYDFLARYEGKLASRVSREVKNKLHTGLKNARRAKYMAGYSGTPLIKKLGIKEGYRVALVNSPKNFLKELGDLPTNAKLTPSTSKSLDLILLFVRSEQDLKRRFLQLAANLNPNGMLWIAWPKKSSGVNTDLSFTNVQRTGLDAGLVDVKICAVNDIWSGLKFVYRLKDRSGRR